MAKMTALPSAGNSRRIQGLLMTMDDAHMTSAIWTALENHHMMGTLRLGSLRCFMRHCNCSLCASICFRCGSASHRAPDCPQTKQTVCLECFGSHLDGPKPYSMIDCAKATRLTPDYIRKMHAAYQCHICGCTSHPAADCNVLAHNLSSDVPVQMPDPIFHNMRKANLPVDHAQSALLRSASDRSTDATIAEHHAGKVRAAEQETRSRASVGDAGPQDVGVPAWGAGGRHARIMEDNAISQATSQMTIHHQQEMRSLREAYQEQYGTQIAAFQEQQQAMTEQHLQLSQHVHTKFQQLDYRLGNMQSELTNVQQENRGLFQQIMQRLEAPGQPQLAPPMMMQGYMPPQLPPAGMYRPMPMMHPPTNTHIPEFRAVENQYLDAQQAIGQALDDSAPGSAADDDPQGDTSSTWSATSISENSDEHTQTGRRARYREVRIAPYQQKPSPAKRSVHVTAKEKI